MFIALEGNRVIDVKNFFWEYAPTSKGPIFCIKYKGERTPQAGMLYDFNTNEVYHEFENIVNVIDPFSKQVITVLSQLENEARELAVSPNERLLYEQGEVPLPERQ